MYLSSARSLITKTTPFLLLSLSLSCGGETIPSMASQQPSPRPKPRPTQPKKQLPDCFEKVDGTACFSPAHCVEVSSAPSICGDFCSGYYLNSCVHQVCGSEELSPSSLIYNLAMSLEGLSFTPQKASSTVILADAPEGPQSACAELLSSPDILQGRCYNVADVRARFIDTTSGAQQYFVKHTRLPVAKLLLFVTHLYAERGADAPIKAASCTPFTIEDIELGTPRTITLPSFREF